MNLQEILVEAISKSASDVFVIPGRPIMYKVDEHFSKNDDNILFSEDTLKIIEELYKLNPDRDFSKIKPLGDDDFSISVSNLGRFRVNVYKQRSTWATVIRVINFDLPDPEKIGIPSPVMDLSFTNKGLVLVTGSAGSGKSTTLSCIINAINQTQEKHIVTLEDPAEFFHRHNKSIISQREISTDTISYATALRASLRQSPDVILIGEMRDAETIAIAMNAAETGHLVFSTLHTVGASTTIDRVINAFPAEQQSQVRLQLSMVLKAVISQQLVPSKTGSLVPAFEIMIANNAVRNLIRESKSHQIDNVIQSSSSEGMITMDTSLINLFKKGEIYKDLAVSLSNNPEVMAKKLV